MSNNEILLGLFVLIVAFILVRKKRSESEFEEVDDKGRLVDEAVTVESVLSLIDDFKIKRLKELRFGYTEKSVQNQLRDYLRKNIRHVTDEYGIEGINATKVDLDLGRGEVGIEIKLAKAVFKAAGQDRMVGQLDTFVKKKYDDNNLILLIVAEKHHLKDIAMREQIESRLEDAGVEIVFFPIKKAS